MNDRASGAVTQQLGFVSYPGGRFQSLTNDTRGYTRLSLSADGKSMVSIQRQQSDTVSSRPTTGTGSLTAVSGIPNQYASGFLLYCQGSRSWPRLSILRAGK